jgi:hypothetical protein
MHRRFAALCVALVLVCNLWVDWAGASSVAIVWTPSSERATETATRLRGEVLAMGIQVFTAPVTEGVGQPLRSHTQLQPGLDAELEVKSEQAVLSIAIWRLDEPHRSKPWATLTESLAAPNAPEKLAIRAAEALHSFLLEGDFAQAPEQTEPPSTDPPPASPSGAQPTPATPQPSLPISVAPTENDALAANVERTELNDSTFGLSLGGALFVGVSGLSAALLPRVGLEWLALPSVAPYVTIAGFGTDSSASTSQGAVRVNRHYGVLGVSYRAETALATPFVAVGAGAMLVAIDGQANAPLEAHQTTRVVGLCELSVGSHIKLASSYYLTAAGHAHFTQPAVAIYVVDERVAISGRPNWLASLALGVRL